MPLGSLMHDHYFTVCSFNREGAGCSTCAINYIGSKCTECVPGFFGYPDCKGNIRKFQSFLSHTQKKLVILSV